jgi:hypothetical protein
VRAALLVLVLLAGAGAAAWLVLRPAEPPHAETEVTAERAPRAGATEAPAVPEVAGVVVPATEQRLPEDPEWHTAPLALPAGRGPLRGSELVAAVEAAGKVRFRGATEADLQALRATVFEHADRDAPQPHAAMMGWLKEAGFDVEVVWPELVVRRRTDEGWTER